MKRRLTETEKGFSEMEKCYTETETEIEMEPSIQNELRVMDTDRDGEGIGALETGGDGEEMVRLRSTQNFFLLTRWERKG